MSGAPLPFSQLPSEPSLKDVLDQFQKSLLLGLNCHHIGTVQSFDATTQTGTATINYKKTFYRKDPVNGLFQPLLVDYPVLIDCPVVILGGGTTALTFPITAGDECLILFNDRDLDNWFAGGAGTAPATPRLHSFADGIILVGLRSKGKVLTGYDTVRACLRNGTTFIGIGASLVKIANQTYNLGDLLQELITEIKDLTTQVAAITVTAVTAGSGVSGVPANAAAIAAVNVRIAATATKIAGLIE